MKSLMNYLLRSKRGLWAALGLPLAVMLAAWLLQWISDMIWEDTIGIPDPLLCDFIEDTLLESMSHIESAAMLAAGFGFLMLSANAFRFGTANSVSRSSVIKAITLSAVITAAVSTLITRLAVYINRYVYEFIWDETLYVRFFFRIHINKWNHVTWEPILDANDTLIDGSELFLRETVMFFLLALIVLLSIAAIYALFRRLGLFGALCGVLGVMVSAAVIVLLREFPKTLGAALFDTANNDVWTDIKLYAPRTSNLIILSGVLAGTAWLVFFKAIKRVGIKPQSL